MSVLVDTELPRPRVLGGRAARDEERGGRRARRGPSRPLIALVILLVVAFAWLWLLSMVKPYRVASGSMAPTAVVGQRILADHLGDAHWLPKAGEIIIFKAPGGAISGAARECAVARPAGTACPLALAGHTRISFVKRVVGLPGDRIQVLHGHVVRNGVPQAEPFATTCDEEICNLAEFTVPAGAYFVLGDNRGDSLDSRFWGPLPRAQILGHAFGSYWPPSRLGAL